MDKSCYEKDIEITACELCIFVWQNERHIAKINQFFCIYDLKYDLENKK